MSGVAYTKQPVKATITDVTASRAIDSTVYQNTTGRPIMVIVSFQCYRGGNAEHANLTAQISVGNSPFSPINISKVGLTDSIGLETEERLYMELIFMVPNEYYYRVVPLTNGTSTVYLETWFEVEL